jgi:hypothetical protein
MYNKEMYTLNTEEELREKDSQTRSNREREEEGELE